MGLLEFLVIAVGGIALNIVVHAYSNEKEREKESESRRIVGGLSTIEDVVYKTNRYRG